jgi:signal transduction histidine kinase
MELELTRVSLPNVLKQSQTLLKERAGRRRVAVEVAVDPSLGPIDADERKVKQIVLNLLSNAVKFTPDGGRVEISARHVNDEVHVAIRDTGVGIAPEDRERIFEEFRRVGVGANKVEGTGLGLALARTLVELHGGRIWVESQLGAGSTFTFALPLRHATGAIGTDDPARVSSGAAG